MHKTSIDILVQHQTNTPSIRPADVRHVFAAQGRIDNARCPGEVVVPRDH